MATEPNYWLPARRRGFSRRAILWGGAAGIGLIGLNAVGCGARSSGTPASSSTGGAAKALMPAAPVKLTASYVATPNDAPAFIAKDTGIFQKHNLDVDLTLIPGPTSVAALIAGQIQVDQAGPGEMLGAIAGGADLAIVAVVVPVFTFKFYARNGITSMNDMKGKKVGITSPGGSFDQSLRAALPKFNLQPDKDVTFIATGSIANVVAALISGSIDGAAIVPGPDSAKVEAAGLKSLFDFTNLNLPNAQACISTTRTYINAHREAVQAYIDSIVEGNVQFKKDRTVALQELGKVYKTDDQAGLSLAYDFYKAENAMPALPYPKLDALQATRDSLCKTNSQICSVDISKVVDPSFVQSASDRGLGKVS